MCSAVLGQGLRNKIALSRVGHADGEAGDTPLLVLELLGKLIVKRLKATGIF